MIRLPLDRSVREDQVEQSRRRPRSPSSTRGVRESLLPADHLLRTVHPGGRGVRKAAHQQLGRVARPAAEVGHAWRGVRDLCEQVVNPVGFRSSSNFVLFKATKLIVRSIELLSAQQHELRLAEHARQLEGHRPVLGRSTLELLTSRVGEVWRPSEDIGGNSPSRRYRPRPRSNSNT